jgi:hypothetical protein
MPTAGAMRRQRTSKGSYDMLRLVLILIIASACVGVSSASDITQDAPPLPIHRIAFLSQDVSTRSLEFLTSLGLSKPTPVYMQQSCCKICTVGKACGNTCIARDKICHVGPGCACDG